MNNVGDRDSDKGEAAGTHPEMKQSCSHSPRPVQIFVASLMILSFCFLFNANDAAHLPGKSIPGKAGAIHGQQRPVVRCFL